MDKEFLYKYIEMVSKYRTGMILNQKNQKYYIAYIGKLQELLRFLPYQKSKSITLVRLEVLKFKAFTAKTVKNRLFVKPYNMLMLATQDVLDVIEAIGKRNGDLANTYPNA